MRCKFCNGEVKEIIVFFPRPGQVPGNFKAFHHIKNWRKCSLKGEVVYNDEVV